MGQLGSGRPFPAASEGICTCFSASPLLVVCLQLYRSVGPIQGPFPTHVYTGLRWTIASLQRQQQQWFLRDCSNQAAYELCDNDCRTPSGST